MKLKKWTVLFNNTKATGFLIAFAGINSPVKQPSIAISNGAFSGRKILHTQGMLLISQISNDGKVSTKIINRIMLQAIHALSSLSLLPPAVR